MEFTY